MKLGPGEPAAGPWRVERLETFARSLTGTADDRPRIVAVDGRGGGGKTTLARRLSGVWGGAPVVHTDDVAWNHSRFGWDDLMIGGIIEPLRAGRAVHYRPPAWAAHGRTGRIDVDAGAPTVIIEGVGAARRQLDGLIDVAVWVQSDFDEARRRGIERDTAERGLDLALAERLWQEWEDEEVPFLLADRPWERAHFIVASTPLLPHDPERELITTGRRRPA
jgi:hypothetical protein